MTRHDAIERASGARTLHKLRNLAGWSQSRLNDAFATVSPTGRLHPSMISEWETGKHKISPDHLETLAAVFPKLALEHANQWALVEKEAMALPTLSGRELLGRLLRSDDAIGPSASIAPIVHAGGVDDPTDAARRRYDAHIRFFQENRAALAKFVRPYYATIDVDATFPLVTGEGWIEKSPLHLDARTDRLILRRTEVGPQTHAPFPQLPGTVELHHEAKDRVKKEGVLLFDGHAYRLIRVLRQRHLPLFEFELSSYFKGIDSCEILGAELAAWYCENSEGGIRCPQKGDLPLRGPPDAIFELTNRHAIAGQNIMLIVLNHRGGHWFYLHQRTNVAEAPNVTHIIPAGTFAPEREHDAYHSRDFSLRRNALREFAEELLSVAEAREQSNSLDTFSDAKPVRPFVQLFDKGSPHMRLYHLGVGLDPITTKPEFLGCLILDMNHVPQPAKIRFEDKFEREGKSRPVELTKAEFKRLVRSGEMLHAGGACIELVLRHAAKLLPRAALQAFEQ